MSPIKDVILWIEIKIVEWSILNDNLIVHVMQIIFSWLDCYDEKMQRNIWFGSHEICIYVSVKWQLSQWMAIPKYIINIF